MADFTIAEIPIGGVYVRVGDPSGKEWRTVANDNQCGCGEVYSPALPEERAIVAYTMEVP